MADKSDWIVGGFQFGTEKDAALARDELLRIENIEEKLDYENLPMVNAVYKKAINKHVFKTPIGYVFLKKLQDILSEKPIEEEVNPIPISGVFNLRDSTSPAVERVKASKEKVKQKPTKEMITKRISIVANIVLLFLVAALFVISINGASPTVLNYEHALQNKYSQWEKELSEREAAIREKEKELLISE